MREGLFPGMGTTGTGETIARIYGQLGPALIAVQPKLAHDLAVASGAAGKKIGVFLSDLAHAAAPSPEPDAEAGGGLRRPIYWMLRGRLRPRDLAEFLSTPNCYRDPSAFAPSDVALILKRLGEDVASGAREPQQGAMHTLLGALSDKTLKKVLTLLDIGLDEHNTAWLKSQANNTELSRRIDDVNTNGEAVPLTFVATDLDHTVVSYKERGLQAGSVDAVKRMCPENTEEALAIVGVTGRVKQGGWFALSRLLHALPAPLQVMHGTWSDAVKAWAGNYIPLGLRKAAFVLRIQEKARQNPNVDFAASRFVFMGDNMDLEVGKILARQGVEVRLLYPADHPVPTETPPENLQIVKSWDEAHRPPTTAP